MPTRTKPVSVSPRPQVISRRALLLPLAFLAAFGVLGFVSRARTNSHLALAFWAAGLGLLGWTGWLYGLAPRKRLALAWEVVPPVKSHYVQALMHLSIYAYWGWYWRSVYSEAPLILSQVAFYYAFDALLTWTRRQTWRMGFGPWPIILSTNLFLWFKDDWYIFQFLMVATAVLGKQFVRWQRDGKPIHIFNPSAFCLTLASVVLILTSTTDCTWGEQIAITQGLPPYLYVQIFFCGIVVQYLFQVTPMTFAAAAILGLLSFGYTKATGVYFFIDSNIPIAVFLGLHLLMTDPATTPHSTSGRLLFGALYGAGVFVAYAVLDALSIPGFYDKLLIVPLLNLFAPGIDRLVKFQSHGSWQRQEQMPSRRRANLALMGVWSAVFVVMLTTGFVNAPHPGATIGFWQKAAEEGRPHAQKNLRLILSEFSRQDLDDPTKAYGVIGGGSSTRRSEALGELCNEVGLIYSQGKWVPTNAAKAAYYFQRSCQFGNFNGCGNLALQYLVYGREEAKEGAAEALAFLEKNCIAMTNGHACFLVGYSYDTGRGNPRDAAKARRFFEQGAAFGDVGAWRNLGRMQLEGEGGEADPATGIYWLQKAVDAQDGLSCLFLAKVYHIGNGVPQDDQQAAFLLQKACSLGVQSACQMLQSMQHP